MVSSPQSVFLAFNSLKFALYFKSRHLLFARLLPHIAFCFKTMHLLFARLLTHTLTNALEYKGKEVHYVTLLWKR